MKKFLTIFVLFIALASCNEPGKESINTSGEGTAETADPMDNTMPTKTIMSPTDTTKPLTTEDSLRKN